MSTEDPMDVEGLLHTLDPDGPVERNDGGWWARWPDLDVRAMATLLNGRALRLITITARPEPDDGYRVIYHWDVGDTVLNLSTTVSTGTVPSVVDIVPGADWAEREIRDYYGLEFSGRAQTPTLMLREGDPVGVFARTCEVARDTDPAKTARAAQESGEKEGEAR